MDQPQAPLIDAIDAFLAKAKMSAVTFGRQAMNDPHFVRDVRNGRRLWPETEEKARQFIADFVDPETPEQAAA